VLGPSLPAAGLRECVGHVTNVNLFNPPGLLTLSQLNLKGDHTYQITFEFDSNLLVHMLNRSERADDKPNQPVFGRGLGVTSFGLRRSSADRECS
jgi:hypothetical protein